MRRVFHSFRATVTVVAMAAAMLVGLASCGDDPRDNTPREPLELSIDTLVVGRDAVTTHVGVTARNDGWSVAGAPEWFTVTPPSGPAGVARVGIAFTANDAEGARTRTATLTFTAGTNTKTIAVTQLPTAITPPTTHPDAGINELLHEQVLDKWYYNGETREVAADYSQSYKDFWFNYLSHLSRNTLDAGTWAVDNEPFVNSYIERNPVGTAAGTRSKLNYGMEFELTEFAGRMVGRVLYVEPGSPAAGAGLRRGDWFDRVNGRKLAGGTTGDPNFDYYYQRLIDSLVHPVAGKSPELGMLAYRTSSRQFVDEGVKRTITPAARRTVPILHTQVISKERLTGAGGGMTHTGYMMLNDFERSSQGEIEAAFRNVFKSAATPLTHFILDLRYNKSGAVETAKTMGDMLVGDVPGVAGKTFARYTFDPQSGASAPDAIFASHEQGVGVDTVIVLTSPHTAGPSELLINALRGLDQTSEVKLVVIGETTRGLAGGMVVQTTTIDTAPDWEYTTHTMAFRCQNGAGQQDYTWGLTPNGGVMSEWSNENIRWSTTWGYKDQPGAIEDPLTDLAMDMILGRADFPVGGVENAARRQRPGLRRDFCFPTNMTITVE